MKVNNLLGKKIITLGVVAGMASSLCACSDITINGRNGMVHDGKWGDQANYFTYNDAEYQVGTIEWTNDIKRVQIDWTAGEINISYNDDDSFSYEEIVKDKDRDDIKMRSRTDGDTLYIKFAKSGLHQRGLEKDLMLKLPKDYQFEDIDIDVVSADVTFTELYTGNLNFDSTSGSLKGDAIYATGRVGCDVVSGGITVNREFEAERLDFDATSGSAKIYGASIQDRVESDSVSGGLIIEMKQMCDLEFDAVSGGCKVTAPEDADFVLEFDTVSGEVRMNNRNASIRDDVYTVGAGTYKWNVSTVSGDVEVK